MAGSGPSTAAGDVLDRGSVDELVADADVVVHLAFIIFGGREETREINLEGSRNVFEAPSPRARSGWSTRPRSRPTASTTTTPTCSPRTSRRAGRATSTTRRRRPSWRRCWRRSWRGSATDPFVFRPCIVAGRDAPTLIEGFTGQTILGPRVRTPVAGARLGAADRAGAARHRHAVPARAPRRRRDGDPRGRGRPGRARHLQPRGRRIRSPSAMSPRRWAGARSAIPRRGAERAGRGRVAGAARPRSGALDQRDPEAGADGHGKARRELRWRPRHDAEETLRETVDGARAAGVV